MIEHSAPAVRLTMPQHPAEVRLDAVQQRVVAGAARDDAGALLVLGAPGTGKTTTAIAAFLAAVERGDEAPALFLAPTRRAAARVRDLIGMRLLAGPRGHSGSSPLMVRTVASCA